MLNVKAQLGYSTNFLNNSHAPTNGIDFKIQFAYGF
jgi:hypothetical protein